MNSKIRIRNLPPEVERDSIQDLLTMVGDVFTIRIGSETGERMAYVQMANEGQAKDCVDRLNKHRFRGHVLNVSHEVVQPKKTRIAAAR